MARRPARPNHGPVFIDKNWSFKKARLEQERAEANGRKWLEPDTPFFQWNALHVLDDLKSQFEAGDGFALLAALRRCANHSLAMPEWVASAYITKYDKVLNCEVASWDEAFGKPYPKKHISKLRQRRSLRFDVYNRLRQVLVDEPDTMIDDGLFERVGAQVGIGKTLCNELYYEANRMLRRSLPPNF